MSLAFVLLDFQHAGVWRRAWCTRRSVDMQQFREVSRTRTIYSTETHTSDFILNTFWNGKPVQFFQERCWVVVMGCQEAVQAVSSLGWGWRDFLNLGPYTHQLNALPWDLTGRESSCDKLLNPWQKKRTKKHTLWRGFYLHYTFPEQLPFATQVAKCVKWWTVNGNSSSYLQLDTRYRLYGHRV